MASDTTSPFSPGRPVPVEFFVGRAEEIERLRRKMRDAASAKRVEVAFISGERGIGKSSLASFVRFLGGREHGALGVHALLGGVKTVEGAVKRVFDQLVKEHAESGTFDSIKGIFQKHVQKVGLFGMTLEFHASENELRSLADNFSTAIRQLLEKMPEKKVLVLILDDLNGIAASESFANWVKSLVDEISVSANPLPVCLFFVGLDERRRSLIDCQPSLSRVFDPVEIRTWTEGESRGFFSETFRKVDMHCDDEALGIMTRYSGGLPVLAHEIGDAVFSADSDGAIDARDAMSGTLAAADRIGSRYLDPVVYQSMRSQRYRAILRHMARGLSRQKFTRAEVLASLPEAERMVLDNFLTKMKGLGVVIEDVEGGRGAYRFATSLHYLYFFLESIRDEKSE